MEDSKVEWGPYYQWNDTTKFIWVLWDIQIHQYYFSIFSTVSLLGFHSLIVLSEEAVTIALLSSKGLIALTDWVWARIPPTN